MISDYENRELCLPSVGRLFTVARAAAMLDMKEHTLRIWISQKKLGVVRFGRSVRVPETELMRFASHGWTPPAEPGR
jgi:excisionase family DNA binding protein